MKHENEHLARGRVERLALSRATVAGRDEPLRHCGCDHHNEGWGLTG